MPDWLLFLQCVLGVYYFSFVVTKLAGPFGVFRELRKRFKTDLIHCGICLGLHLSCAATVLLWAFDLIPLTLTPFYAAALAGANALLQQKDEY